MRDEAIEQFELTLRVAPPEHRQWNEAFRRLCDFREEVAPLECRELLERTLLDDLRLNFFLIETRDYLRVPSIIHRMRAQAALQAGDQQIADREIDLALAGLPAETRLLEDVAPLLDAAGRRQRSDALVKNMTTLYEQAIASFPHCATLYNNVAWLLARCGRRLDEALGEAQKAVELEPQNTGFWDTLAEVHFQRGDRESAVTNSQRAVELSPNNADLFRQLKRFQTDPLP